MDIFNDNLSPMEKTIYCERYVNNGSPSGFTFINTTSIGTRSFDAVKSVKIPVIKLRSTDQLSYFGSNTVSINADQLIIHPDMLDSIVTDSHIDDITFVEAIPMASNRTVFIPQFNKYIKLQYDKLIGRIERIISLNHIYHSMAVNKILHSLRWNNTHFHFFPEEHARIYSQDNGHTIGMIVREADVSPNTCGVVVPAFSLFSVDKNNAQDKSLLLQLIDRTSLDKNEFILSKFIQPAISLYFKILLETGLHIEAHAQNICYIISDSNVEIAFRDFESMDKDLEIATKYNSYFNVKYKCFNKRCQDYAKRHSFMFDFKLGEYLITPILNEAMKAGCDDKYMIDKIKEFVNNFIPLLPNDYFPRNHWYAFPKKLIDRTSSDRPYVENDAPKYR